MTGGGLPVHHRARGDPWAAVATKIFGGRHVGYASVTEAGSSNISYLC